MSDRPKTRDAGPSTRSVHAGVVRPLLGGGVSTPIVASAPFVFASSAELAARHDPSRGEARDEYARYGDPTNRALEARLAALESPSLDPSSGGAEAVTFASGMAAMSTAILAVCKQGAHVLLFRDGYRRTRQLLARTLAPYGVTCTVLPPVTNAADLDALVAAIRPETRLIVAEAPTNPCLHVPDLPAIVAVAKKARIKTIVDATFATPLLLRPLEHGVDLVVHSATKYLAGHHDVLAGVVVGKPAVASLVRELRDVLGGNLDPHAAFLVARGLKTLSLRVDRQSASAMAIARHLADHPRVRAVYYPGLPSHPSHENAKRLMSAYGGVVSFRVRTSDEDALAETSRVIDAFALAQIAPSLGGTETLVEQPARMSYAELTSEERASLGVHDDLIRLAVGIEDGDDLIADLDHALAAL